MQLPESTNARVLARRIALCSLIAVLVWEVFFVESFFGVVFALAATCLYMGLSEWLTPTPAAKRRKRWNMVPVRIVTAWGGSKLALTLLGVI